MGQLLSHGATRNGGLMSINHETLGKDMEAQQEAHGVVKSKWCSTPDGSIADRLCKRVMARIEDKLDVMSAIAANRAGLEC